MTILIKLGVMILGVSSVVLAAEISAAAPTTQMIVTIQPDRAGQANEFRPGDLRVYQGNSRRTITGIEHLSGELAGMELFIYVDDAIDSTTFEDLRPDIERFVRALPETTKVAAGNSLATGSFTSDREIAAKSLKPPAHKMGAYTDLLELMRAWPSSGQPGRRAILVISDGAAREHVTTAGDDLLVQATWRNARIYGIELNTIFVPTARTNASIELDDAGQLNLLALSDATGGQSYHSGIGGPQALCAVFEDLRDRFLNQYRITFEPKNYAGSQSVRVEGSMPIMRITSADGIYIRTELLAVNTNQVSASR